MREREREREREKKKNFSRTNIEIKIFTSGKNFVRQMRFAAILTKEKHDNIPNDSFIVH